MPTRTAYMPRTMTAETRRRVVPVLRLLCELLAASDAPTIASAKTIVIISRSKRINFGRANGKSVLVPLQVVTSRLSAQFALDYHGRITYTVPRKALVQSISGAIPADSSVKAPMKRPVSGGLLFSAAMCKAPPTIRTIDVACH